MTTAGIVTQVPVRAYAAGGFKALDLGTLGGSTSAATAISNSGQVVGASDTRTGGNDAFSWTAAGGMVDLGTLDPGNPYAVSDAVAVNNHGQVVGASGTPTSNGRAFSWTASGGMLDLGTLGGNVSGAVAVNDNGEVIGNSTVPSLDGHAFSWTASGGMVDLGSLGGADVNATALNNNGQVVGWSYTTTGDTHAFSRTASGGMVDLGTLGGSNSYADAVSASGEVVGESQTTNNASTDVFIWSAQRGMVDLGRTSTNCLEIFCNSTLNDAGEVAATTSYPLAGTPGISLAFVWTPVTGKRKITRTGLSQASAINDSGQVVGLRGYGGGAHAFSWTASGGIVPLRAFGGRLSYAVALNTAGDVVGVATTRSKLVRAALWTPSS